MVDFTYFSHFNDGFYCEFIIPALYSEGDLLHLLHLQILQLDKHLTAARTVREVQNLPGLGQDEANGADDHFDHCQVDSWHSLKYCERHPWQDIPIRIWLLFCSLL